ncbi:MAG: YozE family protein [Janthinobacterium lividum]
MEIELVAPPAPARPVARAKLAPRYDASLLAARPAEPAAAINVEAPPADDGLPPSRATYVDERSSAEPFGRWLIGRKVKGDESAIGVLAATAASDSSFPKAGSPEEVRKHLNACGADWDMFEAVESAWMAL